MNYSVLTSSSLMNCRVIFIIKIDLFGSLSMARYAPFVMDLISYVACRLILQTEVIFQFEL